MNTNKLYRYGYPMTPYQQGYETGYRGGDPRKNPYLQKGSKNKRSEQWRKGYNYGKSRRIMDLKSGDFNPKRQLKGIK